jgi:hypothetical protein
MLPGADLIPLYRYTLDCQTCSVELAAANANAVEDQKKIAALEAERDAALKVSRNGNFRHRIREAATWFAIGASVGFTLTAVEVSTHHQPLTRENPYYVSFGFGAYGCWGWRTQGQLR